ncbi:acyltransferase [Myxococcota bacterium]|nr:acyltransferase [Myxococcota bacterium]
MVKRFYSLDVLRGFAALSVVFWHWPHFFFSGTKPETFDTARLPFSEWMFVFYTKGWLAVDLFFCLSGFIFYWLYSTPIYQGEISPSKFALLRFSRLYPLHLATFLFVAVAQFWMIHASGRYFVYPNNDGKHFLLHLLFASSWGFERGHSFNGPVWSVSVEVLLYVIFFFCSRFLPVRALLLAALSLVGFLFVQKLYPPMGRGIGSFFFGGCVFFAYKAILSSERSAVLTRWVILLTANVWIVTIAIVQQGIDIRLLIAYTTSFSPRYEAFFDRSIQKVLVFWPVLVVFPLTILSLALFETHRGLLAKRLSFLGDISYSSYLLHFPMQILFSAIVSSLTSDHSVYYSPWLMLLFFAALVLACFLSFRYIEMPAQNYLRKMGLVQAKSAGESDILR